MNSKLRHIFIFIMVFSVFSLTLQVSVIQLCKGSKIIKTLHNTINEEEQETPNDNDEEGDQFYFLGDSSAISSAIIENILLSLCLEYCYSSFAKAILIPPPKFFR